MTIDEAIKTLKTEQKCVVFKGATNRSDAIKLGIEALKRTAYDRRRFYTVNLELLPGETKD